jgi:hypothetical protein
MEERRRLTVTAATDLGHGILAEIIASLPMSFAHASAGETPDVVEVSAGAAWVEAALAAVGTRPKGILITRPTVADPEQILRLAARADEAGVVVALADPFAGHPALTAGAPLLTEALSSCESLFVTVTLPSSVGQGAQEQVLTALRVVRAVGAEGVVLTTATTGSGGVVVDGSIRLSSDRVSPFAALGTNTRAVAPHVRVRAYGPSATVEIDIPNAATARPARIQVVDGSGSVTAPTIYESAYRAAWRRMHSSIVGPAIVQPVRRLDELRRFAEDALRSRLVFG